MSSDPRYPIGRFEWPAEVSPTDRAAPARLRQVIHHVADSHMNAFIRFKLALTEDAPVIKPYDEAAWALLNDATQTPVETSLRLLENLHERWVVLLGGIAESGWRWKTTSRSMRGMATTTLRTLPLSASAVAEAYSAASASGSAGPSPGSGLE